MGTLYVVATPIGNLADITIRAIQTLLTVPVLACEDTRRAGLLLDEIKKRYPSLLPEKTNTPKLIRVDEFKEQNPAAELIEYLEQGTDVALISDAGTPLVSDPGFVLVMQARKRGIAVVPVPGATAEVAALSVAGLPANAYTFLGFMPEKQGSRQKLFGSIKESCAHIKSTYIMYAAPHKLLEALEDMKSVFGDIDVTLARELTKVHEEVTTQKLSRLLDGSYTPKGEYVVLFTLI
jgi:16S rRNA (cytidine1402-2'-O)-methyltransferase